MPDAIYLDNNATTILHPQVIEAMTACAAAGYANPASQHAAGRRARRTLEAAKDEISRLLGGEIGSMHSDRLILTSGGTESNNLALLGLTHGRRGRVIISSIEHPSVAGPAEVLRRRGYDVQSIRVSRDGRVDLEHLRNLLTADTLLVSVMLGNNETGVLQPIDEIARLCQAAGVPLHTDATQAVGKIPTHFRELGVTALTASAHKLHGPCGIGLLLLRDDVTLEPLCYGGFQQLGFRPGTESILLTVGFHAALKLWESETDARTPRLCTLRDRFESLLLENLPDIEINGGDAPRLPHTSNVAFVGVDRQALVMALDMAGVACSTGSACASGSSEPSPVLLAMGCREEVVDSSLRFSLSALTTAAEIDSAVNRILRIVNNLRSS